MRKVRSQHVKEVLQIILQLSWGCGTNIFCKTKVFSFWIPRNIRLEEMLVRVVLLTKLSEVDLPLRQGVCCFLISERPRRVKLTVTQLGGFGGGVLFFYFFGLKSAQLD